MATTTLTVTINSPAQTINTVLQLTSLVTVNVVDTIGNPVGSAAVNIGSYPAVETTASGVATISDVTYGTYAITITK